MMVAEERVNIAFGFTQALTATLAPGQYEMTCGLLSNPRGRLTVTKSDASRAAQARQSSLAAFVGPLAEYRVYLMTQAKALRTASVVLVDVV